MPVLTDMLQRPTLADLDQEREVVLEEIAMYEDDPQDQIHDLASVAVFPDQALGRPVIGTAQVIGSVPADGVRAYHEGHYTAPNIVVAAAGNITHERVAELADELLGDLPREPGAGVYEAARPGAPTLVVKEKATEQYHLCLGGPGLSRNDPRRHAQSVLDAVLGGSMSSRLFQEIREKRGLAYSVGSYAVGYADTGQVGVYLGTREDNLGHRLRGRRGGAAAHRGGAAARRRAAPREGPPQGAPGPGHGELGHAHEPHRAGRAHGHRAPDGRRDDRPASRPSRPTTSSTSRGRTGSRRRCRPRRSAPAAT